MRIFSTFEGSIFHRQANKIILMKHLFLPLIVFTSCFFSLHAQPYMKPGMVSVQGQKPTLHDMQRSFNGYWDEREPDQQHEENNAEEGGYQQFKRWEAFM